MAVVAIVSAIALVCLSAPVGASASDTGGDRPVSRAAQYKGPSGNRVDVYCQRHLPDDTPRAARLPNRALDCQLQWAGARFGYTGPIDGRLGAASWRGAQRYLRGVGTFSGRTTGELDARTKRAIQRKAAQAPRGLRYVGRVGASLGTTSWRGLAYFLDLPWSG